MQITTNKTAFSLGEVLITLAIIGAVAMLTVPALRKHTQREEYATKLKKAYMSMEQAVDAAIITHGPIDNGVDVKWSTGDIFTKYMKPELIYSEECGTGKTSCYGGAGPSSSVILLDGIGIGASGTTLYVDVNNGNLPNVDGVDLFTFQFQEIGADATAGTRGDWKIVPQGNAKKVADDGWKIKYW